MLTIHNPDHHLHQGRHEMFRGRLVPCHETPQRLDHVLAELQRRALAPLRTPTGDDDALDAALAQIHDPRYLHFIEHAWNEWIALDVSNAERDALPSVWPAPGMRRDLLPDNFVARMGLFSFDAGTPLTAGSWIAARAGAACAVEAAREVSRGAVRAAFALSRPPGHHAGRDFFGGYCFLNNAALAVQALRDGGAPRVAVLDVDYHHGNGTQAIFYERADVLTVSIHGNPMTEYPFFPRPRRRARRGRGRRLQPEPAAATRHRLRTLARGLAHRTRGNPPLRCRCLGGRARRRHVQGRSDFGLPAAQR